MAQIVGIFRIGKDAELRYTPGGQAVCGLSLAFNYGQKGQDGNKPSQWIEAALWGKRAEAMAQYLTKGSQIYCVINDPHIETYPKRDGSGEGFKLAGSISEIEFAGGNQQQGQRQQQSGEGYQEPAKPRNSQGAKPSFDDLGDDIPFAPHAPRGVLAHVI